MRKHWICLLLSLVVLLGISVPVLADDTTALQQMMLESFKDNKMLDILEYEMELEDVQAVYDKLYHSGQLPWYADADCDYVFGENGTISRFRPKELNPRLYDRELYEQKIAELIGETCLPDMTDWQKALSVHDAIILRTAYDESFLKNTGYDSLIAGSTVCYGYAMLYMDVMNRIGIPSQIVVCYDTGDRMGHAWNIVQLDDQWYHVDLTWDDPAPNMHGYVSHLNFLKTDAQFQAGEEPHDFEWEVLETVSQIPYEADDYLDTVFSAVCFPDANTAVYRKESGNTNKIVSRNMQTGKETTLYRFDRKEINLGHGRYLYPTYGLCLWNGRIYFNREHKVLSMLPDGSDVQEVYKRNPDKQYLLGCYVEDGVLHLTLSDHDFKMQTLDVELKNAQFHTHSYHRNTVKSTCDEEGYYEQVCECGIAYNRVIIPRLEHKLLTEVVKSPTQQETGQTRHYCFMCDYEELEELPILPPSVEEPAVEEVHPLLQWLHSLFD